MMRVYGFRLVKDHHYFLLLMDHNFEFCLVFQTNHFIDLFIVLLQEGSMGLIRSVSKFKPQASGRFANYAYWWIKQAVRMAIFRHSRIIRLPVMPLFLCLKCLKHCSLYRK